MSDSAKEVGTGIAREIAKIGCRFDPAVFEQTKALIRPLHARAPVAPAKVVSYGADARNALDVYPAPKPGSPVLIYVPGGGFVGGDKDDGAYFSRNVGTTFSARGYTCVIPNYRLAPASTWPSGADDVTAVLRWTVENCAAANGDPSRIHVCGQSAGATHVSTSLFMATDSIWDRIRTVALLNGLYALEDGVVRPNYAAYFGVEAETVKARLPLALARAVAKPLMLATAGYDVPALAASTFSLASKLTMLNGKTPDFMVMDRHNHVSAVLSVGTAYDDLTDALMRFHQSAG